MALSLPGMFDFAAPPRTGVCWFVKACRCSNLMLFPNSGSVAASFHPWPTPREDGEVLRVALVRHPCHWLRSLYDSFRTGLYLENASLSRLWGQFVEIRKDSFESFVLDCIEKMPGKITAIFDSYKADVRMRIEDMPWALTELLDSLGVEKSLLDKIASLPPVARSRNKSEWKAGLFDRVVAVEKQFCEDLDYY